MDKTPLDEPAGEGGAQAPEVLAVEGFAVEAHDGLIFTVKGLVHPPERRIAYLRYAPDPRGDRERGGRRYRKLRGFAEQLEILEGRPEEYPEGRPQGYLAFDPVAGSVLQGVPVEEAALELAALLARAAGVPPAALGVSGSLLVGLQAPTSDVDLIVYGGEHCRAVHAALGSLLDDFSSPLRRPAGEDLAAIHAAHRRETPLGADDFARLQAGKVNEGLFGRRAFFVRFVQAPGEVAERYGDFRYEPLGPATVEARVTDAAGAIFTPCRYLVEDVRLLQAAVAREGPHSEVADRGSTGAGEAAAGGIPGGAVREIVSFRGRFADQARAGERVRARGTLERATPRTGAPFARLVVGAPGDYLLSLPV